MFTNCSFALEAERCYDKTMKRRYKKSYKKRGKKRNIRLPLLLAALAVLAAAATVVWSFASARSMRVLDEDQIKNVLAANEYDDDRIRVVAEAAVSLVGTVQ